MKISERRKINPKQIEKAAKLITDSEFLVVLTGAGVSTESGIPDFRSPGTGLWSKYSPDISTLENFLRDPTSFWQMAREMAPQIIKAKPNKGHLVLAELDKIGLLKGLITQNIDGLHQKAGNVIVQEIHGNGTEMKCVACHGRFNIKTILKNHQPEDDKYPPTCPQCGAYMMLNVVLFQQMLPRGIWFESVALSQKADVMVVVGSSLLVSPADMLPKYTLKYGGKLIIINKTPTDFDKRASVVIRGESSIILTEIMNKVRSIQKEKGELKPKKKKFTKIKFK
ncbi:MAG: NAD-dependent protein deacylase [Candidatus Lokiarchaeota archaeon]|nr:NAD-dependent protein deacylase [Candidatus Lokiarchaeota archaeon]